MAVDDVKDYAQVFILVGLFLVCIFGFAFGIAQNYGQDSSVMNNEYIDVTSIENQLNSTSESASNWYQAFTSDNLFVSAGAIVLLSIWGILKLIGSAIITFFGLYLDIVANVLGVPPIVTGTLTALLLIFLIFAGWRMVKQG